MVSTENREKKKHSVCKIHFYLNIQQDCLKDTSRCYNNPFKDLKILFTTSQMSFDAKNHLYHRPDKVSNKITHFPTTVTNKYFARNFDYRKFASCADY